MKNYLLEKIGGFTILIMVAFVLAVPIALAESELSKAWQKIISGLDAQYILVCDRGGYGGSFSAVIYAPDDSEIPLGVDHVTAVNRIMSNGWQPLGGVSGTGYSNVPICQAMIKE